MQITHRNQLPHLLRDLQLLGDICEVGVFEGEFSDHILSNWPGKKLVGCDPFYNFTWEEYRDGSNLANMEFVMTKALKRLAVHGDRFQLCREASPKAADLFPYETFDCVYIDANHSEDSVRKDIAAWWPKVRKLGIFGGHDTYNRDDSGQLCGVKTAVDEFIAGTGLQLTVCECSSWFVRKPA